MSKEFDNVISNLQSTRDRMRANLMDRFGDAFDGDFDVMLDAINAMKRYQQNINADRSEYRQLAEQRAELFNALRAACSQVDAIGGESAVYRRILDRNSTPDDIANATQQRNATGGEG